MNTTRQPLLDDAEIKALINRASGWQGLQIPWTDRIRQQGLLGGLDSRQRGSGLDFVESRPYQPGDEPRHIDWRASARTGTPYVRIFHEERSPEACFVIDRRSSMRFGTHIRLKASQAARLAIFLATFEARQGSEVGAVMIDKKPRWIPPTSGLTGIQHIARLCNEPCPPETESYDLKLEKILAGLMGRLSDGTNIYVFSDFSDLSDNALPVLGQLGQHHYVHAINIQDRAERKLPDAGLLHMSWPDTHQIVDCQNQATQSTYIHQAQELVLRLDTLFSKCSIRIDHMPSEVDDIVEWLHTLAA